MKREILKRGDWKRPLNMLPALFALFFWLAARIFWNPNLCLFCPENVYVDKAGFESGLVTVRRDLKRLYSDRSCLQLDHVTSDFGFGIGMFDYTVVTPSSGTYLFCRYSNAYTGLLRTPM